MASPFGTLLVVANPAAGRGRAGKQLPAAEAALRAADLDYRLVLTARPGDAAAAVRDAMEHEASFVAVVGGDGTVLEVVDAILRVPDRTLLDRPVLGLVSAGADGDFAKTFGLPDDAAQACAHLGGDAVFPVDVAKVGFVAPGGAEATRYVPNVAQVGLGGSIAAQTLRLPRSLGRARFFLGFWAAIASSGRAHVEVDADRRSFQGRASNVVVANGQFTSGGMRISPRSWPSDGHLDVLVQTGPRSEAFTLLPRIYRGEHLPHPHIAELRAKAVSVRSDRPLTVEADGQVLGTTPATFEVVPQAIRIKI